MERLAPLPSAEPFVPARAGWAALHTATYTLLALMLVGAAWVRFNGQIAAAMPDLAGPAAPIAEKLADAGRIKGLIDLGMQPMSATQQAIAAMALPPAEASQLTQAVQRRRLRLVRMPLMDLGTAVLATPDTGRSVRVSAGGYSTLVHLSRVPVAVTLPIGPAGLVSFQTASPDGVNIGAITLSGLVSLPNLPAGSTMNVGVLAQ